MKFGLSAFVLWWITTATVTTAASAIVAAELVGVATARTKAKAAVVNNTSHNSAPFVGSSLLFDFMIRSSSSSSTRNVYNLVTNRAALFRTENYPLSLPVAKQTQKQRQYHCFNPRKQNTRRVSALATTAATTTSALFVRGGGSFPITATVAASTAFIPTTITQRRKNSSITSSSNSITTTMSMSTSTSGNKSNGNDNESTTNVVRVGLLQFKVSDCKETNHKTAIEYINRAVTENQETGGGGKGVQILVLPEIWNSPYATAAFPEYAEKIPEIGYQHNNNEEEETTKKLYPSTALLIEYAKKHKLYIVGGSIPEIVHVKRDEEEERTIYYNTCVVVDPTGTIVAKHRKVHLFDIDVPGKITFFESETLTGGNTLSSFTTPNYGTIGIGICYDIRFPEYAMILNQNAANTKAADDDAAASNQQQQQHLTMLIYPGAFNLVTGPAHWELLQRARAVDNQCYVMMASPARVTDDDVSSSSTSDSDDHNKKKYPHYTAYGHSTVVGPWGDIIATTDEKEDIVIADLDLSRVKEIRDSIPILKQKRDDLYSLEEVQQKT